LNSARVIVEAPDVNATGDPTGDAIGEAAGDPTGDACGLDTGDTTDCVTVAALVGIGAGVLVGSLGDESPPHAPTMMATSSKTSSVLHVEVRILRNVIPCPVGSTASIQSVRGIVPKSCKRLNTVPERGSILPDSRQVKSDFMVELGTAGSTSFGVENHSRSSRFVAAWNAANLPQASIYVPVHR